MFVEKCNKNMRNGCGYAWLLLVALVMLVSCEQSPLIHSDKSLPGSWRIENIDFLQHDGWVYLPFHIGDEVLFTEYGKLTVCNEEEISGRWWSEDKFNSSFIYIKMDGWDDFVTARVKDVSAGRMLWAIYPQYWNGNWEGYPIYEITLVPLSHQENP